MSWFDSLMAEINAISDELRAVNELLDQREDERRQRTIEELRESYELIELKHAQKETLQ